VQIARNKCNDSLRQRSREQNEDSLDDQAAVVTEDADPLAVLLDLERAEVLRSCMAKLGDEDRNLLQELELIVHRRWREASQRLGLAESTLRSRWEKVLDRLKRCVEKNL
jgi:DNA-directed RNA polymerase specialized sigma24 family protein